MISLTLSIPSHSNYKILVKPHDVFKKGQILAEYDDVGELIELDVAKMLNVSPKQTFKFFLKNIGDTLEKGEVVARQKKGFFIKNIYEVKSIYCGRISEMDNFTGVVKIIQTGHHQNFVANFSGKVKDIKDNSIVVELKGIEIKPSRIYGDTFSGKLFKLSKKDKEVDSAKITIESRGKILLGGHFSLTDLNKAMAIGAKAVIASEMTNDNFGKFENLKTLNFTGDSRQMLLSIAVLKSEMFEKLDSLKDESELFFDSEGERIVILHDD